MSVRPSVRRPSCGHTSKTEQDRPVETIEHYIEVGTADSVAAFKRSQLGAPQGDILVANNKKLGYFWDSLRYDKITDTDSRLTLTVILSIRPNLLLTINVRCVDNTSGMMPKS